MARHLQMVHSRARSTRRKLVWATESFSVPALAAGATKVLNLTSPSLPNTLGMTVMRMHIRLQVPFVAASDNTQLGFIVGRTADVAANTPTVPGNEALDWMYVTSLFATATGAAVDTLRVFDFDIRSKRKMEELEQILLISVRNNNAAAANYVGFSRVLLALP